MENERTESFMARLESVEHKAAALDDALADAAKQAQRDKQREGEELEAAIAEEDELERQFGEIEYEGCYLDDEEEEPFDIRDARVEAVLARKVHHDVVYYKVKWRGKSFVSWEKDEDIENRAAVAEYERCWLLRAAMPRARRLPPTYISNRRRLEMQRRAPPAANASNAGPGFAPYGYQGGGYIPATGVATATTAPAARLAPRPAARRDERVTWSCEVERFIWIPYETSIQTTLEQAWTGGYSYGEFVINGVLYAVHFANMVQRRKADNTATGGRQVQRIVQREIPADQIQQTIDAMSLDELRQYVANIVDFQPIHYEALSRLHELDRVADHCSVSELEHMPKMTFAEVMNAIANGTEYVGFSSECFICLEDYEGESKLMSLPQCGHFFHDRCATDYFKRYSKLCPVCKQQIL